MISLSYSVIQFNVFPTGYDFVGANITSLAHFGVFICFHFHLDISFTCQPPLDLSLWPKGERNNVATGSRGCCWPNVYNRLVLCQFCLGGILPTIEWVIAEEAPGSSFVSSAVDARRAGTPQPVVQYKTFFVSNGLNYNLTPPTSTMTCSGIHACKSGFVLSTSSTPLPSF